jgi:GH35 family endo-1,4-beta-xylanase
MLQTAKSLTRIQRPLFALLIFIGLSLAVGTASAAPDAYYESLRADLAQRGVKDVTFLLGDTEAQAWDTFRKYGQDSGKATVTPIDPEAGDLGFKHAVRVDTGKQTPYSWSVIWGAQEFGKPMKKGDTVLMVMHVRGVESALLQGTDGVLILKDNKRLLRERVRPPEGEWKRYYVSAVMPRDVNPADAKLELFLGGSHQQVVDVGGVAVINLGPGVDPDTLPQTHFDYDYDGREPDAEWRAEALARIEKHRKGDLTVVVTDAAGEPVPDATVEVRMTRHAFLWGSIIQPEYQFGDTAEAAKARRVFLANFNAITENFKWPAWDGRGFRGSDKSTVAARLNWAAKHNLPVHGHTPLWHKFGTMPFNPDRHSKDEIRQGIMDFLEEVLTYPGVREGVDSWDAINHPFIFSGVWRHIGKDVILEEMRKYEQLVPEHTLFINEGNVLTSPGRYHQHMLDLVDWIMENDAPLDGIGFMGHFAPEGVTAPETLLQQFDDYVEVARKHGRDMELKITEFDMTADPTDPQQIALRDDYTRDFLITVFSHPAFNSLVQWGFWDGRHWREGAGLYDKDWNLKSNGEIYRDLVFNQWWTKVNGRTDAKGRYTVRGFLGDYQVTVTQPSGEVRTKAISLPREGIVIAVDE